MMHVPPEILRRRLIDGTCHLGEVRRHVMLESLFTDKSQQLLHMGNSYHARASKRLQRIVRELAFANIPANLACVVIRREAQIRHRPRLYTPHAGAEGVSFAD